MRLRKEPDEADEEQLKKKFLMMTSKRVQGRSI